MCASLPHLQNRANVGSKESASCFPEAGWILVGQPELLPRAHPMHKGSVQDCALTRSLESSESHVGVEESGSRMPQRQEQPAPLYDVAALQTWLLLCCQV